MHRHIRPDIDYKKCNAFSAVAHMYAAIDHNGVPNDKRGGIIVFAENVKEVAGLPDIKASWKLGHFLKGRYTDQKGLVYSGDSWCVEITGVSDDALIAIGEELCRANDQVPVLIKVYSERNKILLVDGD